MLLGLHIEHELRQRPVQPGDRALHHRETCATELDAQAKVQPQRLAQVHMVFDGKVKGLGRAPAAHQHIALLILTHRHALVRQIRHGQQHGLQLGLQRLQPLGRGLEFVLDAGHSGHHGISLGLAGGTACLELANLFAQGVALVLQFFGAHLDGLALGFEPAEGLHIEKGLRLFAGFQPGHGAGEVFAKQGDIEHGLIVDFQAVAALSDAGSRLAPHRIRHTVSSGLGT